MTARWYSAPFCVYGNLRRRCLLEVSSEQYGKMYATRVTDTVADRLVMTQYHFGTEEALSLFILQYGGEKEIIKRPGSYYATIEPKNQQLSVG